MSNLKGWRSIIFFVLTAGLAGVASLTEFINIPEWYFLYIVPAVGVLLRYLTTTPIGEGE